MGLFKSKEEKRIERDIEVRKGINSIKRNVKELKRHENSYLEKAKRAKQIDDEQQLQFLKRALRKCILTRKMRERQLLSIETAMQIRNQAEADANFARCPRTSASCTATPTWYRSRKTSRKHSTRPSRSSSGWRCSSI
jgi:hypothetical protein